MHRNIFHRDQRGGHGEQQPISPTSPEFRFIRSDTTSETVIHPPAGPGGEKPPVSSSAAVMGRKRSPSTTERIKNSFHLGQHRQKPDPAVSIPDLPQIKQGNSADEQAQWEQRATILAKGTVTKQELDAPHRGGRSRSNSVVSVKAEYDETIQEAIRLHEAQDYPQATLLFKKLADPNGANNPLSQVLYALSLRHGWGCETDEAKAAEYLRLAASNAADIEEESLRAGVSKGGAAKGELVLAIYELANCYRQGWGVPKDLGAAFQYYLTAANLGDTDAMNEVALCYLEGYGTKKNKYEAARYYRLAEAKGNKTVGNSWIYKEKYIKYEENGGKKK